jgi:HicB family
MELTQYVEKLRGELAVAAEAGGDEARALAERLSAPLDSAIRLMLLDALSAAADEITRELAPGSVELRLRAGEPEFVVSLAPSDEPAAEPLPVPSADDEGATARINLRLPEQLKASVEQAAASERLSVNSWLVRAAAAALGDRRPAQRGGRIGQSYTGWVQ